MELNSDSVLELKSAIKQAVDNFTHDEDFEVITDIHMHLDEDSGIVTLYDDEDVELARATVEEWVDVDSSEIVGVVVPALHSLLHRMSDEKAFENVGISKPFSFVLEDEEKETIEELYLVDDDTVIVSSDLLKGLDKELDDFLDDLLK